MLLVEMNLTDWNVLAELIYRIVATLAIIGTLVAAFLAVFTFRRNARLDRARWALSLYEKFYEKQELKKIRDVLDCESDTEQVNKLVLEGKSDFTDYLNFFEFVAFLQHNKQLQNREVEDLFGYYLDCLKGHERVRKYIKKEGYEKLDELWRNGNEGTPVHLRHAAA
ncbi:MAG TPA: hypothetical protein VGC87_23140 [Pyrinomonadaceae bacterium]|jgi:hypothetical protein